MIRALGLLEKLAESKLDFVFKGGTSLILLVEKPERFSIDIDINTTESKETIENILEDIIRMLFKTKFFRS
jgi:predicted nucleotidyltransferase component of viral defense system